jgi:hypothetical protein
MAVYCGYSLAQGGLIHLGHGTTGVAFSYLDIGRPLLLPNVGLIIISASVSGRPGVIDARNFGHDAKN